MNFIFSWLKNPIFYSLAAPARKILFLPLENRIHIFSSPCNIYPRFIFASLLIVFTRFAGMGQNYYGQAMNMGQNYYGQARNMGSGFQQQGQNLMNQRQQMAGQVPSPQQQWQHLAGLGQSQGEAIKKQGEQAAGGGGA